MSNHTRSFFCANQRFFTAICAHSHLATASLEHIWNQSQWRHI